MEIDYPDIIDLCTSFNVCTTLNNTLNVDQTHIIIIIQIHNNVLWD